MSDMNRFDAVMAKLEAERDELRVQLNLAKMEAKEEWEALEKKMDGLRGRVKVVSEEAKDAGSDVGAALDVVAEEVKQGFSRLRKML